MIVVDTNVVGYLYLRAEQSAHAERVFLKDSEWAAPFLWRSEFRNVLAQYIHRRILRVEDAAEIMDAAQELMLGREYDVSSSDVLKLAALSGCTAYDCEFVALARELRVPLVTVDRRVVKAFPDVVVSLEMYAGA